MKTGILERILTRRFGEPDPIITDGLAALRWESERPDESSLLYLGMKWHGLLGTRFAGLREIYGRACGGLLIGDSLKVAMLLPRRLFAIWNIDQLRMLEAIQRALVKDPSIEYFMDAANVWYYGHKAGELYVFDHPTDELDSLGPIEPALETLIDQWEEAR